MSLMTTMAPASAVSLDQAAHPRETPPGSFQGDVYVDSRGCAYARSTVGNQVNWVPRLSSNRKEVVCGLTPTNVAGTSVASAPPPPPPPPPPVATEAPAMAAAATPAATPRPTATTAGTGTGFNLFGSNLPTPSPAPEPTRVASSRDARSSAATPSPAATSASRTLQVTCPAAGETARVRIGSDTIAIQCAAGVTRPVTYLVRHGNGEVTRLVANPAPVTMAAPAPSVASAAPTTTAPMTGSPRVRIGGVPLGGVSNGFGNGYGLATEGSVAPPLGTPPPAPAVPSISIPRPVAPPADSFGNGYGLAPVPGAGRVYIPSGYRPAWTDDRLNPSRGPRSAGGDAQMAALYDTSRLPMRERAPTATVAAPPAGYVLATKSPAASAQPAAAPAARGYRYVQVGAFNVADNATRAAARLKALGLPGRVAQTASGRRVVVAGPYADAAELQQALATARRGGFSDAFLRS